MIVPKTQKMDFYKKIFLALTPYFHGNPLPSFHARFQPLLHKLLRRGAVPVIALRCRRRRCPPPWPHGGDFLEARASAADGLSSLPSLSAATPAPLLGRVDFLGGDFLVAGASAAGGLSSSPSLCAAAAPLLGRVDFPGGISS